MLVKLQHLKSDLPPSRASFVDHVSFFVRDRGRFDDLCPEIMLPTAGITFASGNFFKVDQPIVVAFFPDCFFAIGNVGDEIIGVALFLAREDLLTSERYSFVSSDSGRWFPI